jgi:hypothetical protein
LKVFLPQYILQVEINRLHARFDLKETASLHSITDFQQCEYAPSKDFESIDNQAPPDFLNDFERLYHPSQGALETVATIKEIE